MRSELHCLRKHVAQEFVKDFPKQESYVQKLALEKVKKICNLNIYLGKSQHALDKYISQIDHIFRTNALIYTSKETKCFYTTAFLFGIP